MHTERENNTLKMEENTMTDQTNTYFQAMQQTCIEFDQARKARRAEKTECRDAAALDAWYKREKGIKFPYASGQMVAYHAWFNSIRNQSSAFEVQDLPWEDNAHDFVETLRAAGITEFAVTDNSTALMRVLHEFAAEGCTMQGLCKVTRWGSEGTAEYNGILFRT